MTRRPIAILVAVSAAAIGTAVLAGPIDDVVAMLKSEGYASIEIETKGAHTEIEGKRNGMERELLLVTATGEVVYDQTETEYRDSDDGDDS